MKKESPLYIADARICSFSSDYEKQYGDNLHMLAFDNRRDLLIDAAFAGVAVKVDLCNNSYFTFDSKGVRRNVSLILVDTTSRCEVAAKRTRVSMPARNPYKTIYAAFPLSSVAFESEHTYKIVVRDDNASATLDELVFHLFGQRELGHPAEWYTVEYGGVRPDWSQGICRSVKVDEYKDLNVRFDVGRNFADKVPVILPELELRLYYPDGDRIKTSFVEPQCIDYGANSYCVELQFCSSGLYRGVYYAELLCMEYPIAGFVFRTFGPEIDGGWYGEGLEPLGEYSVEAARARFERLVPTEDTEVAGFPTKGFPIDVAKTDDDMQIDDDEFDALLDQFIESQFAETDKSECSDDFDDADTDEPECSDESEASETDEPDESSCSDGSDGSDESDSDVSDGSAAPSESVAEADDHCETNGTDTLKCSVLAPLDRLVGLRSVKEKLRVYERVVRFNKMRADKGLPVSALPLHAMFLGSPGTGKTTVAKLMGYMLRRAGVLSRGHVVVRERATLLGQYYSTESEKTLAAIKEAQGGILLIDEAYQLYQPDDPRDPGKFVIETLLTTLADESKRDWMLVLAGYPDEMKRMFEMNPGFKSRIPDSNIYMFDDFSECELMEIAEKYLSGHRYSLAPDARTALTERLRADYSHRDKNFGNARHVVNLIQTEILPAMAVRVTDEERAADDDALTVIQSVDVPRPIEFQPVTRRRIGFIP